MDQGTKIQSLIRFLQEVEQFKTCERTCQTTAPGRAESDAEHSWHLAMLLLLLEQDFTHLQFSKILKMALIHDLPEIYAGDSNPYRDDSRDKEEREQQAAQRLFADLPDAQAHELHALFNEYIAQQSPESKVVKAADKLMPLVQNLCTNTHHSSYRKLDVHHQEVVAYMAPFFTDGILHEFYTALLAEAKQEGVFASEE